MAIEGNTMSQLENLNIVAHEVLITPEQLKAKLPVSEEVRERVQENVS